MPQSFIPEHFYGKGYKHRIGSLIMVMVSLYFLKWGCVFLQFNLNQQIKL